MSRHRLTRAGLKRQLDEKQAELQAEKKTSTRLANQLASERQQHSEELTRAQLTADREIRRLLEANRAWQARYANEHAMSDLNTLIDTVPNGTDVSTLREQFGPVVQVPVPDEATDPTHIPVPQAA
ncbi:hypothetical protein [Streptomyces sp. NPDC059165]|uniref:hypothetical protein n=1 Tax=Streptomyces sp. NPDC059165 TaxID=3346751 RepID=UPI0036A086EE